jgi:hypothetical protein
VSLASGMTARLARDMRHPLRAPANPADDVQDAAAEAASPDQFRRQRA